MRMRRSMAQLEQAFVEEAVLDRHRREHLRRKAAERSRQRHRQRVERQGSVRFILLALSIIGTAVVVTIAMFETLYYLLS